MTSIGVLYIGPVDSATKTEKVKDTNQNNNNTISRANSVERIDIAEFRELETIRNEIREFKLDHNIAFESSKSEVNRLIKSLDVQLHLVLNHQESWDDDGLKHLINRLLDIKEWAINHQVDIHNKFTTRVVKNSKLTSDETRLLTITAGDQIQGNAYTSYADEWMKGFRTRGHGDLVKAVEKERAKAPVENKPSMQFVGASPVTRLSEVDSVYRLTDSDLNIVEESKSSLGSDDDDNYDDYYDDDFEIYSDSEYTCKKTEAWVPIPLLKEPDKISSNPSHALKTAVSETIISLTPELNYSAKVKAFKSEPSEDTFNAMIIAINKIDSNDVKLDLNTIVSDALKPAIDKVTPESAVRLTALLTALSITIEEEKDRLPIGNELITTLKQTLKGKVDGFKPQETTKATNFQAGQVKWVVEIAETYLKTGAGNPKINSNIENEVINALHTHLSDELHGYGIGDFTNAEKSSAWNEKLERFKKLIPNPTVDQKSPASDPVHILRTLFTNTKKKVEEKLQEKDAASAAVDGGGDFPATTQLLTNDIKFITLKAELEKIDQDISQLRKIHTLKADVARYLEHHSDTGVETGNQLLCRIRELPDLESVHFSDLSSGVQTLTNAYQSRQNILDGAFNEGITLEQALVHHEELQKHLSDGEYGKVSGITWPTGGETNNVWDQSLDGINQSIQGWVLGALSNTLSDIKLESQLGKESIKQIQHAIEVLGEWGVSEFIKIDDELMRNFLEVDLGKDPIQQLNTFITSIKQLKTINEKFGTTILSSIQKHLDFLNTKIEVESGEPIAINKVLYGSTSNADANVAKFIGALNNGVNKLIPVNNTLKQIVNDKIETLDSVVKRREKELDQSISNIISDLSVWAGGTSSSTIDLKTTSTTDDLKNWFDGERQKLKKTYPEFDGKINALEIPKEATHVAGLNTIANQLSESSFKNPLSGIVDINTWLTREGLPVHIKGEWQVKLLDMVTQHAKSFSDAASVDEGETQKLMSLSQDVKTTVAEVFGNKITEYVGKLENELVACVPENLKNLNSTYPKAISTMVDLFKIVNENLVGPIVGSANEVINSLSSNSRIYDEFKALGSNNDLPLKELSKLKESFDLQQYKNRSLGVVLDDKIKVETNKINAKIAAKQALIETCIGSFENYFFNPNEEAFKQVQGNTTQLTTLAENIEGDSTIPQTIKESLEVATQLQTAIKTNKNSEKFKLLVRVMADISKLNEKATQKIESQNQNTCHSSKKIQSGNNTLSQIVVATKIAKFIGEKSKISILKNKALTELTTDVIKNLLSNTDHTPTDIPTFLGVDPTWLTSNDQTIVIDKLKEKSKEISKNLVTAINKSDRPEQILGLLQVAKTRLEKLFSLTKDDGISDMVNSIDTSIQTHSELKDNLALSEKRNTFEFLNRPQSGVESVFSFLNQSSAPRLQPLSELISEYENLNFKSDSLLNSLRENLKKEQAEGKRKAAEFLRVKQTESVIEGKLLGDLTGLDQAYFQQAFISVSDKSDADKLTELSGAVNTQLPEAEVNFGTLVEYVVDLNPKDFSAWISKVFGDQTISQNRKNALVFMKAVYTYRVIQQRNATQQPMTADNFLKPYEGSKFIKKYVADSATVHQLMMADLFQMTTQINKTKKTAFGGGTFRANQQLHRDAIVNVSCGFATHRTLPTGSGKTASFVMMPGAKVLVEHAPFHADTPGWSGYDQLEAYILRGTASAEAKFAITVDQLWTLSKYNNLLPEQRDRLKALTWGLDEIDYAKYYRSETNQKDSKYASLPVFLKKMGADNVLTMSATDGIDQIDAQISQLIRKIVAGESDVKSQRSKIIDRSDLLIKKLGEFSLQELEAAKARIIKEKRNQDECWNAPHHEPSLVQNNQNNVKTGKPTNSKKLKNPQELNPIDSAKKAQSDTFFGEEFKLIVKQYRELYLNQQDYKGRDAKTRLDAHLTKLIGLIDKRIDASKSLARNLGDAAAYIPSLSSYRAEGEVSKLSFQSTSKRNGFEFYKEAINQYVNGMKKFGNIMIPTCDQTEALKLIQTLSDSNTNTNVDYVVVNEGRFFHVKNGAAAPLAESDFSSVSESAKKEERKVVTIYLGASCRGADVGVLSRKAGFNDGVVDTDPMVVVDATSTAFKNDLSISELGQAKGRLRHDPETSPSNYTVYTNFKNDKDSFFKSLSDVQATADSSRTQSALTVKSDTKATQILDAITRKFENVPGYYSVLFKTFSKSIKRDTKLINEISRAKNGPELTQLLIRKFKDVAKSRLANDSDLLIKMLIKNLEKKDCFAIKVLSDNKVELLNDFIALKKKKRIAEWVADGIVTSVGCNENLVAEIRKLGDNVHSKWSYKESKSSGNNSSVAISAFNTAYDSISEEVRKKTSDLVAEVIASQAETEANNLIDELVHPLLSQLLYTFSQEPKLVNMNFKH